MATIKQTVCDRCGKPMKYIGWTARIKNCFKKGKKIHIIKYHNGNPNGYSYVEMVYELCADCTKELENFINQKEGE